MTSVWRRHHYAIEEYDMTTALPLSQTILGACKLLFELFISEAAALLSTCFTTITNT